jgi:hypothetical protein
MSPPFARLPHNREQEAHSNPEEAQTKLAINIALAKEPKALFQAPNAVNFNPN